MAPALVGGFELPSGPRLPRIGSVDAVALEERAATLAKRSIKRESKVQALELAVRDDGSVRRSRARTLPARSRRSARRPCGRIRLDTSIPAVAAVCVYPSLVEDGEGEAGW